jgi:ParB family chromosome partitioning protein
MAKARGLGRGLNALIPSSSNISAANNANNYDDAEVASENGFVPTEATNDSVATGDNVRNQDFRKSETNSEPRKVGLSWVEISTIAPNPYQPRKHIDPEILNELADSIKELGIIQPPVVSYNPDFDPEALKQAQYTEDSSTETLDADGKNRRARYLLIAGERRWQASKLAGLTTIPVVIKESTPLQMLEMALVENIQRADLNPLEEAQAYHQLVSEFKLTQQDVARRVGKSRAAVANALRLLSMHPNIYARLNDATITEGHARALLMVESEHYQMQLLQEILKDDLSVRQAEEKARRYNALASTQTVLAELEAEAKAQRQIRVAERQTRELEDHLRRVLDTKVDLIRSKKGGKITIQFFSEEELENVFRRIVGDYEI